MENIIPRVQSIDSLDFDLDISPRDMPVLDNFEGDSELARRNRAKRDLAKAEDRGKKRKKFFKRLKPLRDNLRVPGSIITQSQVSNPNQSGSMLAGGIGGLLSGGILGALSGLNQVADHNDSVSAIADLQERKRFSNTGTIQTRGKGGSVKPVDVKKLIIQTDHVPVQTEVNETILLKDMSLIDSSATEKHEKMDKTEVTEVLPIGTEIFSDRKGFSPKAVMDMIIGYQMNLTEDGGTMKSEAIKMSNVFGNKKKNITFAEASKEVVKSHKTHNDNPFNYDTLDVITNLENKASRRKWFAELIRMQSGKGKEVKSKGFTPKKYMGGGTVGDDFLDSEEYKDFQGLRDQVDEGFDESFDFINDFEDLNIQERGRSQQEARGLFGKLRGINNTSFIQNTILSGLQQRRPAIPTLENVGDVVRSDELPSIASLNQARDAGRQLSLNKLTSALQGGNSQQVQGAISSLVNESVVASNNSVIQGIYKRGEQQRQNRREANAVKNRNNARTERFENTVIESVNDGLAEQTFINDKFLSNKGQLERDGVNVNRSIRKQFLNNNLEVGRLKIDGNNAKRQALIELDEIENKRRRLFIQGVKDKVKGRNKRDALSLTKPSDLVPIKDNSDILSGRLNTEQVFDTNKYYNEVSGMSGEVAREYLEGKGLTPEQVDRVLYETQIDNK